jgi:S1-C subfamily serine protease
VRLGPGEACAACQSQDAWSRWEGEGKLVIDRASIEAAEARRRGDDKRKLYGGASAAALLVLLFGLSGASIAFVIRVFQARPLGPLEQIFAGMQSSSRVAAGSGLLCLLLSLLAMRLPHPRRGRLLGIAGRFTGVVTGAAALLIGGFMSVVTNRPSGFERVSMPPRDQSGVLSEPAARVMAATAVIVAPDADGDGRGASLGTGAVVAAGDGRALIVTCSHVAMPYAAVSAFRDAALAHGVWVELADGRDAPGKVVWTAAPPLDVALVEIHVDSPPEPVPILLGGTEGIDSDEAVFFVPNPYRHGFLVSNGRVVRREAHETPAGRFSLLFTTLPLESGDSGSGLFDARGRLIGLNTWQRRSPTEHQGISLPAEALAEITRVMQERVPSPRPRPRPLEPPRPRDPAQETSL